MNYGLFIKTLGPHGAPRVPWDPRGSKFGPRPPGPNFDPQGPQGTLGALGGEGGAGGPTGIGRIILIRLAPFSQAPFDSS